MARPETQVVLEGSDDDVEPAHSPADASLSLSEEAHDPVGEFIPSEPPIHGSSTRSSGDTHPHTAERAQSDDPDEQDDGEFHAPGNPERRWLHS